MKKSNKRTETSQMTAWTGQFGDDYIKRNEFADWKMTPGTEAFRRMLGNLKIKSVLEIGSNIGLNLIYINNLFKGKVDLNAIEPNPKAYDRLISQPHIKLTNAWNCDAFKIPLPDASIDLVFTSGVLIHIAPENLAAATDEIVRITNRYVLCIEYFADKPIEEVYRNQSGLLFKRDFGAFYQDRYPNLECIDYGFLWQRDLKTCGNSNWWLFKKEENSH